MPEIWVRIRIKLRWLLAAVVATEQQCIRDHTVAAQLTKSKPDVAAELRAEADLQHEAHQGLKAAKQEIEDDHV